jgi:quercetin dioxygenase-like cupin family protein
MYVRDMAALPAPYEIEGRELIAEAPGLRVQVLTLDAGQSVPWHHHSEISDTFFCLRGPMIVETRDPRTTIRLHVGQRATIPPGEAHHVAGVDGGPCQFVIVQGVGVYDYLPEDAS